MKIATVTRRVRTFDALITVRVHIHYISVTVVRRDDHRSTITVQCGPFTELGSFRRANIVRAT
jgi:hypothetical protein